MTTETETRQVLRVLMLALMRIQPGSIGDVYDFIEKSIQSGAISIPRVSTKTRLVRASEIIKEMDRLMSDRRQFDYKKYPVKE